MSRSGISSPDEFLVFLVICHLYLFTSVAPSGLLCAVNKLLSAHSGHIECCQSMYNGIT